MTECLTGVKRLRNTSCILCAESKSKRIKLGDVINLFSNVKISNESKRWESKLFNDLDRLTGCKRKRAVAISFKNQRPFAVRRNANKRAKLDLKYLMSTPFDTLICFEPHILNIISSYGSSSVNALYNTHHHWWYIFGLSKDVNKAWSCATRFG